MFPRPTHIVGVLAAGNVAAMSTISKGSVVIPFEGPWIAIFFDASRKMLLGGEATGEPLVTAGTVVL